MERDSQKKGTLARVNVIDIILSIALALGFIRGFSKGFVVEVASLGALFLGLLGAIRFSGLVVVWVERYYDWNPLAVQLGSYFVVFLVIVYAISILAKALTKIISKASLGLFNKFLGAFFGVLKWSVLMSVGLFFLGKLNTWITIIDSEMIEGSILYEPITQLGDYLFSWGSQWSDELSDDLI